MAEEATELRDREANFKLQLDACDLGRHENGELAVKAFEPSQNLRGKWLTADYSVKRRYLEIVFLNFVLDHITLVPTTRKPFDVLAEGLLVSSIRGDRIPIELFLAGDRIIFAPSHKKAKCKKTN